MNTPANWRKPCLQFALTVQGLNSIESLCPRKTLPLHVLQPVQIRYLFVNLNRRYRRTYEYSRGPDAFRLRIQSTQPAVPLRSSL